jgi:hypothetical protein
MTFLRRLGLLAALAMGSCAAPDSEIHLAPIFSRHTAPDYQHAEGLGGILRYHREADTVEWALSPLVYREKNGHGDINASFLGGLGAYEYDPDRDRSYARLFPLWSYRSEIRPDGIRDTDWAALLYLIAGGSSSDALEDYFWIFPLYGTGRDFWTYDEFKFFLFPLYMENHKEERDSYHWLWPFFGKTEGSEKGWHIWPLRGVADVEGQYRRSYTLWPFWHYAEDELYKPEPRTSWMLFPFFGKVHQDDYEATTVLPPFFGWAERPSTEFSSWQFWPLIKFQSGGNAAPRKVERFLPFWLHYEDEQTEYSVWLFPFFWHREDHFNGMERTGNYFVPFFMSTKTQRDDGTTGRHFRLWPLFSYEFEEGNFEQTRFLDLGLPKVLNPNTLARSFGFIYEFWFERESFKPDPLVVKEKRAWLNLYHETEAAGHKRWSLPFIGGQWTEPNGTTHSSWLFGLLRWRSGDNGGMQSPAFPGPGWPDIHAVAAEELE